MPKGIYVRRPRQPKLYPAVLVEQVRTLYRRGYTMAEVARQVGTTTKTLQRLMPNHGIARRTAIKRDQTREMNAAWKGDDAGYSALHRRVHAVRGLPLRCEECGATDGNKSYDWANLTGNYADVYDYRRMCRSCHRTFDNARRKRAADAGEVPNAR